ncbi:MAG TPA: helix-turn-helix domain-containing protein [Rhizomicrobium sp.]|jgi:DNA-binding HxlR family transcriptional regulator|nr:helix-turn-helix domain-containing protein [Rhizomicrobium sp.]
MQRKDFGSMLCPVARTLERVGEWWSILILRDAFHGLTRFDQFQTSLGIAPNMLTRRLDALVEAGLLARRLYNRHPPRYEYVLTPRGRDFWPVLVSLMAYGNRHFAREGIATELADVNTGNIVDPVLVDRASGTPLDSEHFKLAPGPAANSSMRLRMKYSDKLRSKENAGAEWAAYAGAREKSDKRVPRGRRQTRSP